MSDDAAVWKVGFGVLLLAVCGLTVVMRKHHAPPPPAATVSQPPAVVVPLPDAAPPGQKDGPAPPPLEASGDDSRVQQTRAETKLQHRPVRRLFASTPWAQPHARRIVRPRIQRVVALRPQYPFDPRERWKPRF